MTTRMKGALSDLENAWNKLAPVADIGFVPKLCAEMRADGTAIEDQCKAVVGRLYDGLAWGNWPSA